MRRLLDSALDKVAQQKPDLASLIFRRATEQFPADERPWLGLCLVRSHLYSEVKVGYSLELGCESNPASLALHSLLTRAWVRRTHEVRLAELAAEWIEEGMPEAADFVLDLALARSWRELAMCAHLWELKASVAARRGRVAEAIGALRRVQALGGQGASLRYLDALDLERQGLVDLALQAYADASAVSSLREPARFGQTRLLAALGRFEEAMNAAEGKGEVWRSAEGWRIHTWVALRLGRAKAAQAGIEALKRLTEATPAQEPDEEGGEAHLPGYPAPYQPHDRTSPEALFALKVPRLLEVRRLVPLEQTLVQDWCLRLPERSDTWPLGKLAGQPVRADLVTRDRHAYVARFAPALVGREQLSLDELHGWCALVELGRVREVTLATSAPLAPDLEMTLADARMRLGAHADGGARLHHVVIGERDGVLG